MKRSIKANEQTEFRVVSFGVDVVIPAEMDASVIEDMLYDLQDKPFNGQARIAGVDFKQDLTQFYERDYPGELFIQ